MKVAIVDYGAGNTRSLANAVIEAGGEPVVVRDAESVLEADRLILPGVGAASLAMERLERSGLAAALTEAVTIRGRPFLGICLGLHLIASRLTEFGNRDGLGWIKGKVVNLNLLFGQDGRASVPHTGWSNMSATGDSMFSEFSNRYFYFNHSFALVAEDEEVVAARVVLDSPVVAAIATRNILACQFHPETSQRIGRQLLETFLDWRP